MAIKPIVGKFRRGIVLDLSVAFGTLAPLPAFSHPKAQAPDLNLRDIQKRSLTMAPILSS
ncbi:hypothetical protein XANCAGTX0491_004090 [Xanthoria calcicola]